MQSKERVKGYAAIAEGSDRGWREWFGGGILIGKEVVCL